MHNLSGFFDIVILLGAIQGFIISSLLFFSKENRLSNRLLGIFIFLIALATFNCYLIDQNWYTSTHFFQLLSAVFSNSCYYAFRAIAAILYQGTP